jgi:hypothetical protein
VLEPPDERFDDEPDPLDAPRLRAVVLRLAVELDEELEAFALPSPLPLPFDVERDDDERELAADFTGRAPAPFLKRPVRSRGSSSTGTGPSSWSWSWSSLSRRPRTAAWPRRGQAAKRRGSGAAELEAARRSESF